MGDILIPKSAGSEEFSKRLGLRLKYGWDIPVVTAVSSKRSGHIAGLELDLAEDFRNIFPLSLELSFFKTESKLFNSTFADGTTSDGSQIGWQAGFGRLTRYGSPSSSALIGSISMMGRGSSTSSPSDRSLGGENFSFPESGSGTFDISTRYLALGEIRPSGRGPAFYAGLEGIQGVSYAGEGSPFNRLYLDLRLTAGIGFSDASAREASGGDRELGAIGIAQGLYSAFHGAFARYTMARTLSDPQSELGGGSSFGGDRGAFVNVPPLLAASSFLSATNSSLTPALRSGDDWFWVFAGANALTGALSFSYDSPSASTAGATDMLNLARLMAYPAAGIDTPSKRRTLKSSVVQTREAYIDVAGWILNSAVAIFGAMGGSGTAVKAGVGANLSIAGNPDPIGRGLVERTNVSVISSSALSGSNGGNRAGVMVHNSLRDFPSRDIQLFSELTLISPQFLGVNLENHYSQDEAYSSDSRFNTDIGATLGIQCGPRFAKFLAGVGARAIYGGSTSSPRGGSDSALGGMGPVLGLDVIIPFSKRDNASGLTLGGRASFYKILPDGGNQTEGALHAGLSLGF